MIYIYKIDGKKVAIAAASTTVAKYGLRQRYPDRPALYVDTIDEFFQVEGTLTVDMERTEIEQQD